MRLEGSALVELLARPASVAVVGASADPRRLSGRPLDYLKRLGYAGRIYAVNARADLPGVTTVRSLLELEPGSVDVALVALPAEGVVAALRQAEEIGARAAVVIASGFEDRDGPARRDLDRLAASSTLRIIGPNCVGTLGVAASSYLTFSSVLLQDVPRPGRVGLVTQSGALGNSLLQSLIRRHVGLNQWFSTGDETDTGAIELATGLLERQDVDAVGMFLEGVTDRHWLGRLESVLRSTGKPLFLLKAAHSESGRMAAAGHTGRVVGSADASEAILAQAGVRQVASLAELADALVVAGANPGLLRTALPSVSLVSVSGAAGVIGADRVAQDPRLRMAAVAGEHLPLDDRLRPQNPLDVPFINETGVFTDAVGAMGTSRSVDIVVGVESSLAHDREELVAKVVAAPAAPVVLTSLSEDDTMPAHLTEALRGAGIAYLPTVDRAVRAIALCAAAPTGDTEPEHDHTSPADLRGIEWVADRLPDDLPWVRWRVLADEPAVDLAVPPYVVKAAGRTILHRTELGAVRVVRTADEAVEAVEAVRAVCRRYGDAVMVQDLAPDGFEVLVSVLDDPEFGPVAFVRPGGTLAELMSGQAVVWSGWPERRRLDVLRASRIGELLESYRGGKRYDIEELSRVVSQALAAVAGGLEFLELNPVIVHENGISLVDAAGRPATTNSPEGAASA
ncbi:acetate--CoA ligase family protein [Acrocarpospora catenulata]|uniref:acetate--CoA ligase family protein n=1 Tax=Acrocarpospora catenulata TaxID=2836182 RepID=UPI001BDA4625|nr:acetate--CoA ligase family protein [Acrocarpospora catenulata]